jgi:hypothetical protein
MRIPRPPRRLRVRVAQVFTPMSPRQPRAFRPAWWTLAGWYTRTAVGCGPTVQQPAAGPRSGGTGDDHNGRRSRWWRHPWVGGIGGATTYHPASRTGARADIVPARAITAPPVGLAQHQARSEPQPAATAYGPTPTARVRVVLLPHARAEPSDTPSDTPANNPRTGRVTGMNQGDSGFRK